MLPQACIEAIEAGRAGVHVTHCGDGPYEATGIRPIGLDLFVETKHLNGEPGPELRASECTALERTYEDPDA